MRARQPRLEKFFPRAVQGGTRPRGSSQPSDVGRARVLSPCEPDELCESTSYDAGYKTVSINVKQFHIFMSQFVIEM